ncbi:uncharacterized protein M6B38_236710 [Iris pallida]|uniref:DUF4220 domain-containing protein n=1 Tax=Iris pallida TaxID=29817 RepID=A0AAX6DNL3_IRIPA|nr:uncharacterized protein M6B38_236710 [Iris pallida]
MLNSVLEFLRAVKMPMGKLIRIEGLVVMTAAILLLMSVLESYRRRSQSSVLKLLLLILDTVSASTVTYTTGLIQNASIENELLQVWVVLLTTLKESNDHVSAYGVEQTQDRRRREFRDLMESCWVAYLNATRGTKFKYPLWILWGLNTSKILHRIISFEHATHSYSFGKNPLLAANYMKYEHTLSELDDVDPVRMRGFKYLVLGEDKQKVEPTMPGYQMRLTAIRENKLITLDKIWQCDGRLLSSSGGDKDGRLKDLCLSFAMYKLLRRRFGKDNIVDEEPDHPKNRDLVLQGLLVSGRDEEDDASERLFRVIEVELAFLTDHFYSRYPIVFSKGLPTFSIVRVVMVAATSWLVAAILVDFNWREGALRHVEHGVDVGKVITLVLLFVLIAKEAWEIITYILSDWAKVVLICKYVEQPFLRKSVLLERLLGILCRCRITRPWHGRIGQYSLLDSFGYKPWNLGHKLTWGLAREKKQGAKRQRAIKLPDGVRRAIVDSLRSNGDRLMRGRCSLERNGLIRDLSWTLELQTNTETILAWHIATGLCETEMILRRRASSSSSSSTCIRNWWRRQPSQPHYEVAASLSRYCAYLIVSNQDMLSDPATAAEVIFDDTICKLTSALKGCTSTESKYVKLMKVEEEPFDSTTINNGAKLGKFLIDHVDSDDARWKVLAEVWAEVLLYVAPTSRSSTHEASLAKGGEFVTHLWALLSHAGILKKPEPYENI